MTIQPVTNGRRLPSRPKVGAEPHAQSWPHGPSGRSALRSVALEIPISPVKGLSSSRTRKIAPANDSAQINSEAITTRLVGANKVKLTKIALSQKTRNDQKRCRDRTASLRKQEQPGLRAFSVKAAMAARLQRALRVIARRQAFQFILECRRLGGSPRNERKLAGRNRSSCQMLSASNWLNALPAG